MHLSSWYKYIKTLGRKSQLYEVLLSKRMLRYNQQIWNLLTRPKIMKWKVFLPKKYYVSRESVESITVLIFFFRLRFRHTLIINTINFYHHQKFSYLLFTWKCNIHSHKAKQVCRAISFSFCCTFSWSILPWPKKILFSVSSKVSQTLLSEFMENESFLKFKNRI